MTTAGPLPRAALALCLLTVCALTLRWWALDYLLPHHPEPDAQLVLQAREFQTGEREVEFARSTYPHLISRLIALLPVETCDLPLDPAHEAEHLRAAASPYLQGRRVCAALSALAVPLTFLIARRWLSSGGALLAAALLATSLLHLNYSQQARPHAPFATLVLLCLWAALRARERPSNGRFLALGLVTCLAAGSLHSAICLVPVLPLALLLAERSQPRPLIRLLWPLLGGLAALPLFWPFLFDPPPPGTWSEGESYRFPHRLERAWFDASGFVKQARFLYDHDPLLLGLGALGLGLFVLDRLRGRGDFRWRPLLLLLGFVLPYGLLIGLLGKTFPRFFIPLLPPLAILCAWLLERLWSLAATERRGALALASSLLLLAFPSFVCARLVHLRSLPDTWERAANDLGPIGRDVSATIVTSPNVAPPRIVRVDPAFREHLRTTPQHQPWFWYLERSLAAGKEIVGPRVHVWQLKGRFIADGLFADPSGAEFAEALRGVNPDAALLGPIDHPKAMQAMLRGLELLGGGAYWIPAGGATVRIAYQRDYQDEDLLHRVLARGLWGPAVLVHRSANVTAAR